MPAPGDDLREEDHRSLNTEATVMLARAAQRAGVKRFIFLSSIAAQSGYHADQVLTEDLEPHPVENYGRSKLAAEQGLAQLDLDWVALRLVLVYGPGMKGNIARIMQIARSPLPRVENAKRRPREYLTVKEVTKLIDGARERGRYGHRDATMILVGYRHGLRVSELCALRWDQFDFERGMLHVRRVKNGTPSVHPLGGSEIRSLRRLRREQPESRYVFLTERQSPMSPARFRKLIARTGEGSKFPFPVHPVWSKN